MQSRRRFLGNVSSATAASIAAGAVGIPVLSIVAAPEASAAVVGPLNGTQRANKAYQFRHKAALDQKNLPLAAHPTNGDDETYASFIGS